MADGFDPVSYVWGQRSVDPNAEYYTKSEIDILLSQKQNSIKIETGDIAIGSLTKTINYSGDLISAFALNNKEEIIINKTINSNSVVFTLGEKKNSVVNCFVIYI